MINEWVYGKENPKQYVIQRAFTSGEIIATEADTDTKTLLWKMDDEGDQFELSTDGPFVEFTDQRAQLLRLANLTPVPFTVIQTLAERAFGMNGKEWMISEEGIRILSCMIEFAHDCRSVMSILEHSHDPECPLTDETVDLNKQLLAEHMNWIHAELIPGTGLKSPMGMLNAVSDAYRESCKEILMNGNRDRQRLAEIAIAYFRKKGATDEIKKIYSLRGPELSDFVFNTLDEANWFETSKCNP